MMYEYKDGSKRYGEPPFPKYSPIEQEEAAKRGEALDMTEKAPDSQEPAAKPAKKKGE